MKASTVLIAAVAALWAGIAFSAEPEHGAGPRRGPATLDDFYAKPDMVAPSLSPSGRYLAMVRRRGTGQLVVVLDRQTGTYSNVTYSRGDKVGFGSIGWKGEDRLLLHVWLLDVRRDKKNLGHITAVWAANYLELIDRDGKNPVAVFQNNASGVASSATHLALISTLKSDPGHILVAAPDGAFNLSVWKVDVRTGVASIAELGDAHTVGWWVDRSGTVVARTEERDGGVAFEGRQGQGWSEVLRIRRNQIKELADFEIFGAAEKPGQLYVGVRPRSPAEGDTRTLRIYDFNTRSLSAPLWPSLKYDISGIVFDEDDRLSGVCYTVDVETCDFKDPTLQARFAAASRYFNNKRSVMPISSTNDHALYVLAAHGPDAPGSYYLFDTAKKQMDLIGDIHPELPAEKLGRMEIVSVKTRDGQSIPAYLTHPPGSPKGPLPLIVLPHGGPEARDSYDYDLITQYLATRGYLVLQPNFRGSGGYGAAFAELGYRQWGKRMQDDVIDAARSVIASGAADPDRVCIFGASYGGYAALQAGATEPGMFKCVISMAGVANLASMLKWERTEHGADSSAYKYWIRSIGDPAVDADAIKAASPVTYAAGYTLPVLLIHGDADDTVPLSQSKEMEKALRSAGKPVKLIVLADEGHGGFAESHGRLMLQEVESFLATYLHPSAAEGAVSGP